ncbi:MAG: RimK/LysX family protein [Hymenobacteraceae bacterium]|nr:RimK/LysX family protein [Hymenobacteraceae bacterium]MDX5395668.1 RimK/LysX family protein [Hymenobacteraceae bacterium]MDX5444068.1 RimK/LysX family protein [Hymenobacteraceae bacterium]MDX5511721.1 RimK/LysX family protein [Hymenobacteraceae bacterium]
MRNKKEKKTVGRREMVDFPELDLFDIEAKIDTGAYTSAIHCSDIEEEEQPDGSKAICFKLLDESHPQYNHKQFKFKDYTCRAIKNSFGDVQERYIIRTTIQLFEEALEAEFSLSDRSDMKYPVLIGRALLQGHFIVDVSRKNVSLKQKQKKQQQN